MISFFDKTYGATMRHIVYGVVLICLLGLVVLWYTKESKAISEDIAAEAWKWNDQGLGSNFKNRDSEVWILVDLVGYESEVEINGDLIYLLNNIVYFRSSRNQSPGVYISIYKENKRWRAGKMVGSDPVD